MHKGVLKLPAPGKSHVVFPSIITVDENFRDPSVLKRIRTRSLIDRAQPTQQNHGFDTEV